MLPGLQTLSLPSAATGTTCLVWEEGHCFYLRPVIKRNMPENHPLSPVISHIQGRLIIAKSEASCFTSHQSEQVDYLWVVHLRRKSKKEGAAEFNMVRTTSTGFVGHLTKTSRLLSLEWFCLSKKNMPIFILDSLSEPGGSRRHSQACAMVHRCLLSFELQSLLR